MACALTLTAASQRSSCGIVLRPVPAAEPPPHNWRQLLACRSCTATTTHFAPPAVSTASNCLPRRPWRIVAAGPIGQMACQERRKRTRKEAQKLSRGAGSLPADETRDAASFISLPVADKWDVQLIQVSFSPGTISENPSRLTALLCSR